MTLNKNLSRDLAVAMRDGTVHVAQHCSAGVPRDVLNRRPLAKAQGQESGEEMSGEKEAEKQAILADLETIKAKPTKKAVEDVIFKHNKKGADKK